MPNPVFESVTPPYTAFRFEVLLNLDDPPSGITNPLCEGAFAECDGLEMSMEPNTFRQGGDNSRQHHRAGPLSYAQLTLRRGMTGNLQLWQWMAYAGKPGHNPKAQGQINVWNPDGTPGLEFVLTDCLPIQVRGPSLNAQDGGVAIEELQVAYAALAVRMPGESTGIGGGASASAGISVSGGPGLSVSASASVSIG